MGSEPLSENDVFTCRLCGDCCKGFGGTYVTETDMRRISEFLKADPVSFKQKYCDPSGTKFVLSTGTDGRCIFFDPDRQCTIHPVKPRMCRAWPYIQTLVSNPENWEAMANSCPGMKKGIPLEQIRIIAQQEVKTQQEDTKKTSKKTGQK